MKILSELDMIRQKLNQVKSILATFSKDTSQSAVLNVTWQLYSGTITLSESQIRTRFAVNYSLISCQTMSMRRMCPNLFSTIHSIE